MLQTLQYSLMGSFLRSATSRTWLLPKIILPEGWNENHTHTDPQTVCITKRFCFPSLGTYVLLLLYKISGMTATKTKGLRLVQVSGWELTLYWPPFSFRHKPNSCSLKTLSIDLVGLLLFTEGPIKRRNYTFIYYNVSSSKTTTCTLLVHVLCSCNIFFISKHVWYM